MQIFQRNGQRFLVGHALKQPSNGAEGCDFNFLGRHVLQGNVKFAAEISAQHETNKDDRFFGLNRQRFWIQA